MLVSNQARRLYRPWVCNSCRALKIILSRQYAKQSLPKSPVRARFAPSPTGYLHLGSLRTALFNFLLARATGGQFILRIEDTDKKRTVADAEQRLCQDLKWAGLDWDEGPDIGGPFGPYRQSERTYLYQKVAKKLLDSGRAYRCFCSAERLNKLAQEQNQLRLPNEYDGFCAEISKIDSAERDLKGEKYVVRLGAPKELPAFKDLVYGVVGSSSNNKETDATNKGYDNTILLKSDGLPTYHLANVVDDHHMGITHVIRGTEWMSSTPKHLAIYRGLKWKPPRFAHVGLLQNSNREKFSKRGDALDIRSFEKDGIFPEALVNYVALFGWSHKLPSDFLSLQDLIRNFSLKFTKGNIIAAPTKLFYLQKKYAQKYVEAGGNDFDSMVAKVCAVASEHFKQDPGALILSKSELEDRVRALIRVDAQNYTSSVDFLNRHDYAFRSIVRAPYVPRNNVPKNGFTDDHKRKIKDHFEQVSAQQWAAPKLDGTIITIARKLAGAKSPGSESEDELQELKQVIMAIQRYLRWAVTGGKPGPGITAIMGILGRETTLSRLQDAQEISVEFKSPELQEPQDT